MPMSQLTQPFQLQDLKAAIRTAPEIDSLPNHLTDEQWGILGAFLQPRAVPAGEALFTRGDADRHLYLIESGTLSVHLMGADGKPCFALIGAGTVVGEGAFFVPRPRSATAQTTTVCRLWALAPTRFAELGHRQPAVALALTLGVAAVQAKRLLDVRRWVASA